MQRKVSVSMPSSLTWCALCQKLEPRRTEFRHRQGIAVPSIRATKASIESPFSFTPHSVPPTLQAVPSSTGPPPSVRAADNPITEADPAKATDDVDGDVMMEDGLPASLEGSAGSNNAEDVERSIGESAQGDEYLAVAEEVQSRIWVNQTHLGSATVGDYDSDADKENNEDKNTWLNEDEDEDDDEDVDEDGGLPASDMGEEEFEHELAQIADEMTEEEFSLLRAFALKVDDHLTNKTFEKLRYAFLNANIDTWTNTKARVEFLSALHPVPYDCYINSCCCYVGPHADATACPFCCEPRLDVQKWLRKCFIYIPIIWHLVDYFRNPAMVEKLQFAPFKKWKHTAWPLLLFNYNLPPEIQFHLQYIMCIGVIPELKKPKDFDSFLWPCIEELLKLFLGVKAFDVTSATLFALHAYLIFVFGDMLAIAMVMRMKGHNVQFALSTAESERLATAYGVKGIPLLLCLSSISFPQSFPCDFMHLIYENLIKNLVLLWTRNFKDLDEGTGSYELNPTVWKAIGAATAASSSTIPSAFGARPPNVTEDKTSCTAKTCKIPEIRRGLAKWVEEYERLYYQYSPSHLSTCPVTIHALLHLADSIEEAGPVWAYWAFPMEHFCGLLQLTIKSCHHPYASMDSYLIANTAQVQGSFAHPSYSACELLPSRILSGTIKTSLLDKILVCLSTQYEKLISTVRKHVSMESIEQWGKVRRVDRGGGDTMHVASLAHVAEDGRDAMFYDLLVDMNANNHDLPPKFQPKPFFGQLKNIFVVRLPATRDLRLTEPMTLILAAIKSCHVDAHNSLDMQYYQMHGRTEVVNMTTVQCVVGRVKVNSRWAILDWSGGLTQAFYDPNNE
ncbi:hypothetical protein Hypma_008169 [Hypsizygus marmoreus]|uniref:Uncharacterized protein n=1 Tax=Hypsizygus marmoreus TaxID=39966 RepID=A0A369JQW8_HYPMA|nr:hypothetical protein Hypma_008169 [Hypsizygus marmoreus]